ncbi:hypothetical protein ACFWWM_00440 [Streptomyces sp. NPDC058682]|uniref:hypothetical protein n=1 Tax=Streptomyces sp. NPDC058682 TaxID=3346596 RepID=UPI0036621F3E
MLKNRTGDVDLGAAGIDLQEIDILWDVPQVISVARLRFSNGTRYEVAVCPKHVDRFDIDAGRALIPEQAMRVPGADVDTLGCEHGDEYTFAFWVFE